jgi:hypothetical protein
MKEKNMKEKNKPTAGPLFNGPQKQTRAPEETITTADTGLPITTAPLPVPVETGGDIQLYSDSDNDMFDINENYDSMSPSIFPMIKILRESQQWNISTTDEVEETAKFLRGIIVTHSYPNALFLPANHELKKIKGESKYPDCHSFDGKKPHESLFSESCNPKVCKFNGWQSQNLIDPAYEGYGKACKNMVAILFLLIGFGNSTKDLPDITDEIIIDTIRNAKLFRILMSPTSLTPYKTYMGKLGTQHQTHFALCVNDLSLKKVENKFTYSVFKAEFIKGFKHLIQDPEFKEKYGLLKLSSEGILTGKMLFSNDEILTQIDEPF